MRPFVVAWNIVNIKERLFVPWAEAPFASQYCHDYLDCLIFIDNNLIFDQILVGLLSLLLVRKWRPCPWNKHWDDLDKQKCIFCHLKNSQNILKVTQIFLGFYLPKYFEDLNFFENTKCNTRPLCCNSIERVAG